MYVICYSLLYITTGRVRLMLIEGNHMSSAVIPHFSIASMQYSSLPKLASTLFVPKVNLRPRSLAMLMILRLGILYRGFISRAMLCLSSTSSTLSILSSVQYLS